MAAKFAVDGPAEPVVGGTIGAMTDLQGHRELRSFAVVVIIIIIIIIII